MKRLMRENSILLTVGPFLLLTMGTMAGALTLIFFIH